MQSDEMQERLLEIEREISKGKKDGWDIFNIIASLAIPASIAGAGYMFSQGMKQAEIQSSREITAAEIESMESIAAREENIAIINAKISQASLLATFIDHLTSEDLQRQKLAVKGILLALPDKGPEVVEIVSKSNNKPELQSFARDTLDDRRTELIVDMFSESKTARISATTELVRGWTNNPYLVPQLTEYTYENKNNKNGVINALTVLDATELDWLNEYFEMVESTLKAVENNGPQTMELVNAIRNQFGE